MKSVSVSPFLKMKADQLNWTGYNSALVEECSDLGLQLQEENRELQERLKLYNSDRKDFFDGAGRVVAWCLMALIGVFVFSLMVRGVGGAIAKEKISDAAYFDGASDAVTYVEAKYRSVKPEEIKLEFSESSHEMSKRYWISAHSGRYVNLSEVEIEYVKSLKTEQIYKVFVNK